MGEKNGSSRNFAIQLKKTNKHKKIKMKIAEITYTGDLRNSATHLHSGATIITDAPIDNNGKGEAFSPTDLLATSLGVCMLTIMGIVAERNGIDMKNTKADVVKIMGNNPRKVKEIGVFIYFPNQEYTEKEKSLLENAARTCPVALSLHPEIKQDLILNFK